MARVDLDLVKLRFPIALQLLAGFYLPNSVVLFFLKIISSPQVTFSLSPFPYTRPKAIKFDPIVNSFARLVFLQPHASYETHLVRFFMHIFLFRHQKYLRTTAVKQLNTNAAYKVEIQVPDFKFTLYN